ncbi:hypothetical protein MW887_005468 [Aspergillus wentii]|nr:hypothetical protein MW887_005468 [Aspergillus wentii]
MKITFAAALLLLSTTVTPRAVPQSDLVVRDVSQIPDALEIPGLEKRRGGGGGGGKGGSGSGGSSGGRTGSGGSSSGSGSTGGRTGSSSSGRTGSSSNVGGSTRGGSGPSPAYGGGSYYAGGAASPYRSGAKSPLGVSPYLLPAAGLALLPGVWLYGAYAYPYHHNYHYVNQTNNHSESLPVVCVCQEYSECGCDNNSNSTYFESLFNGTEPKNTSVARVVNDNGTEKIYINGTLPNGTTVEDSSASSAPSVKMAPVSGYWIMVAVVSSMVWAL